MKKHGDKKQYKPTDSNQVHPTANQTVKTVKDTIYQRESATMNNPEQKRKYSEQPPSKHNTHS